MNHVNRLRGIADVAILLTVLTTLFFAAGCSSPERAPRTPTPEFDTPGETAPEKPRREGMLVPFVDDVVAAMKKRPGIVAVFPALTKQPTGRDMYVNGLGQRLAVETADDLRTLGYDPLTGDELINDVLASNRGLSDFRTVADVFWLAERVGAEYAVYGTVQKKVYDPMKRDEQLDLSLYCVRVSTRTEVARFRKSFTGGKIGRNLYRDYTQPSDWKIGVAARPFQPSADGEVKFATRSLVSKIIAGKGSELKGKRMAIDPVLIRGVSGPAAGNLEAFTTSFLREFDKAEREAAAKGSTNPEVTALDHGPVTVQGKEYRTLGNVLDVVEERRAALRTSRAGELSIDIARMLAEQFAAAADGAFEVLADDPNRASMLDLIKREAKAARDEGAVNPATIAELRTRGAQLLVRATFRPFMRSYRFRIFVLDTATGKVVANESLDFEVRFKIDLDALTAG